MNRSSGGWGVGEKKMVKKKYKNVSQNWKIWAPAQCMKRNPQYGTWLWNLRTLGTKKIQRRKGHFKKNNWMTLIFVKSDSICFLDRTGRKKVVYIILKYWCKCQRKLLKSWKWFILDTGVRNWGKRHQETAVFLLEGF